VLATFSNVFSSVSFPCCVSLVSPKSGFSGVFLRSPLGFSMSVEVQTLSKHTHHKGMGPRVHSPPGVRNLTHNTL